MPTAVAVVGVLPAFVCVSVCLSVCLSARYLKNRCSYDHQTSHTNVRRWFLEIGLFWSQKVKGQGHESRVLVWVFALLWVLASSNLFSFASVNRPVGRFYRPVGCMTTRLTVWLAIKTQPLKRNDVSFLYYEGHFCAVSSFSSARLAVARTLSSCRFSGRALRSYWRCLSIMTDL